MKPTVQSRFWSKVNKRTKTECWLWTAATGGFGYGRIIVNGVNSLAHRISWQLNIGKIPDGLCVLHKCDVPACVNPNHLFLGTKLDNTRDCIRKGRKADVRGENNPRAKLTEIQIHQIRKDKRIQREIAAEYGLYQADISRIKLKKNWKHI